MLSALLRILRNILRLPLAPFWWWSRRAALGRPSWLTARIRPRVVELASPRPWFASFVPGIEETLPTSLVALRKFAARVADDPRVEGVVFEIPQLLCGWATASELREAIRLVRATGKKTVAYLPRGGSHKELYVATACARVLGTPAATYALVGLAAEVRYFKDLLDEIGVAFDVHARAEFKTAMEPFARSEMSEAQRQQTEAILGVVDGALRAALAERPRIGAAGVPALFERGMWTGSAAVDAGILDDLAYADALAEKVDPDRKERARMESASRWFRWNEARFFLPIFPRPYVAVIPVHGTISEAVRRRFVSSIRAAASDRRAVGAVIHVDSPGGSALVSDLVHREVALLKEKKPVVACFGDVAASGGYYVAAPAQAIVASPLTVTGSIGVLSAKVVAAKLLERLHVRTEVIRTAPHADMFSVHRPLDADEHAIFEREMDQMYETFVGVVAAGRNRARDEIEPLARGRVWSGKDAREHGLVDAFGGLDRAVEEVRSRLPGKARSAPPALVLLPPWVELPPIARGAAGKIAGVLEALGAKETSETLALFASGERVLLYASGVPEIA